MTKKVINVAIIAHVDHGKTTLVDKILEFCGIIKNKKKNDRILDSDVLEKERGITIFSKNCSVEYESYFINIVDTPGHSDFGGEVERVLSMVDGVLLLIDAVEGPMPQTRFVTKKALELKLKPIVVINKIDRKGIRVNEVIDDTFELFFDLNASEEQLDFKIIYTSATLGYAKNKLDHNSTTMEPLLKGIINNIPPAEKDLKTPFKMQITSLDYSDYLGKIGIGRVNSGKVFAGQSVTCASHKNSKVLKGKLSNIFKFKGLGRIEVESASSGDIISINGIEDLEIGSTIREENYNGVVPSIKIDDPTLKVNFLVNTSPLSGKEGKFITSRQIRERLEKELQTNIALRVEFSENSEVFEVSGRGELHLTILIESLRREGFELAIGKPKVINKMFEGTMKEPFEYLTVDIDENYQGVIMDEIGKRKGELMNMKSDEKGRIRIEYKIPSRGLVGFQTDFLSKTRGTGILSHVFESYEPLKGEIETRRNGVLISQVGGEAVAYSLWKLQERGKMFIKPGEKVYEGMIIGINSRENDLVVNPIKNKQLTNIRASGKDEAINLNTPIILTLEKALDFIAEDEFVEVTPKCIRIRKINLKESDRKRQKKLNS